ncbi:MAG: hypothetical protein OQK35_01490 [Alphaproteobacteria bacterium]|nr:hypothetical protein [Rhodospirillales bacterium]MCW9044982.1 hypothetical protein [Alphaproteobacteria bacterium]
MDVTTTMNIYDEAFDEATEKGISIDDAHREAIVAAAMMLAAMDGVEDNAARTQVEEIVQAHAA